MRVGPDQDLVFNQWWSEEDGVTDSLGEFNVRGFLGDYEVVVDYDGVQRVVPLNLETGSNVLTVVVPEPSTLALMLVGIAGMATARRRRQR